MSEGRIPPRRGVRARPAAAGFALLLVAASLAGQPADRVRFSAPPPPGLSFKRVRVERLRLQGTVRAGTAVQKLRQSHVRTVAYTETIVKVENGRVAEVIRDYDEADTTTEFETDKMLRPRRNQDSESYCYGRFRATWPDGKLRLEGATAEPPEDQGSWQEAMDADRRALRYAFDYPDPLLPATPRTVGESWTVGSEALARRYPGAPDSGKRRRITGSCRVTFTGREGRRLGDETVPCAVLTTEASVLIATEGQLPMRLELKGTHHYSLRHHLIVHSHTQGTVAIRGRIKDHEFDHAGTFDEQVTVEILRP